MCSSMVGKVTLQERFTKQQKCYKMPHSPALLSTCKQQVEVTEKGFWLSRESRCVWCLREENEEQGIDGCEPAEGDPSGCVDFL